MRQTPACPAPSVFRAPLARSRAALVVLGTLLATSLAYVSQVNAATREATLYTIGPGSAFSERYGHSVICTAESSVPVGEGTCVDFGVPVAVDASSFTWSMVRGKAQFIPTPVAEATVLGAFRLRGRKIESQRLPLTPSQLERLAADLTAAAEAKAAYAYHPYWSNCSTQLRDRLDRALEGRLQSSAAARRL
jgi:hypothetical protein